MRQSPSSSSEEPLAALSMTLPDTLVDALAARLEARIARRPEPWVGVAEVARHIGCRPQRVYDLVYQRSRTGIPHRKEGSRLLFRLSEIDRWIESGSAGPS